MLYNRPVRALALILVLAAGCLPAGGKASIDDGSGGFGGGSNGSGSDGAGMGPPNSAPCDTAADCALAAATCCDCPSFAVGAGDANQCQDVGCPMMPTCPTSLVAACVNHTCTAACAEQACASSCANGYATDAAGCLTCACAGPADGAHGCVADTDCVEIPADCCGCTAGGTDTAVLASEAQAYHDMLGCSPDAHCPPTNTCTPGDAPRCVQGQCALVAASEPSTACGRADLPPCAAGAACIVNRNSDATMYGVGVCGMP